MPVGAIIGAAGAIGGSLLGGSSTKKAANTAASAADRTAQANNALSANIYGQNKELLSPYSARGNAAGASLNALLGLGGDTAGAQQGFRSYIDNSNYAFDLGNGQNALNQGYAAQGALQSGAAMKALEQQRQSLQNGYRGEYMGHLANQQGVGLSGASAVAGVGQNYASNVSANNNSAGTNAANAALMGGYANNQMWSGIGNTLGNLASSYFKK